MRNRKPKNPPLATANQPFTPMTHKPARPVDTPYQPLRLGDLATPVLNKSHTNEERNAIDSPLDEEGTLQTGTELNELKSTLLRAISIIDKMEASKRDSSRKYRSIQTQTDIENPSQKQLSPSSSESTEISITDSSDSMVIKKKTDKNSKRKQNQQSTVGVSGLGDITTPKPRKSSGHVNSTQSSGDRIEEKALQDRMHDLSLLLKRLENQLGEMNQTDSY